MCPDDPGRGPAPSAPRLPWWDEAAKRSLDVVAASVGLLVLSPVMLAITLALRLASPGPALYRGLRTGRYGVPFRIFKFRTMVVDAEKRGGTTTGKNDPRVTKLGRFLRRHKLDELPQLFNVLRGDMSLVGPRPEVSEYTDQFSAQERLILSVRPGITDYSSLEFSDLQEVVGERDVDQFFRKHVLPRKNALRLKYVRQRSFLVDIRILLRTAWVVGAKLLRRPRGD